MNTLTNLVNQYIKKNQLSRKQLAQLLGYKNISKGLRNLDNFIVTLIDINQICSKIPKALNIPEQDYINAINEVRDSISNKEREKFEPSIHIIPSSRPTPLIGANLLHIKLPKIPNDCDLKVEIQIICEAFKKWQLRINHNNPLSPKEENDFINFQKEVDCMEKDKKKYIPYSIAKGFRYIKSYDECLNFDRKCNLIVNGKITPSNLTEEKVFREEYIVKTTVDGIEVEGLVTLFTAYDFNIQITKPFNHFKGGCHIPCLARKHTTYKGEYGKKRILETLENLYVIEKFIVDNKIELQRKLKQLTNSFFEDNFPMVIPKEIETNVIMIINNLQEDNKND